MAAPKGRVPILEAEIAAMARRASFEWRGVTAADGTATIIYDAPFTDVTFADASAVQSGGRPTKCDIVSVGLSEIRIRTTRTRISVPVLGIGLDVVESIPATAFVLVRGFR